MSCFTARLTRSIITCVVLLGAASSVSAGSKTLSYIINQGQDDRTPVVIRCDHYLPGPPPHWTTDDGHQDISLPYVSQQLVVPPDLYANKYEATIDGFVPGRTYRTYYGVLDGEDFHGYGSFTEWTQPQ